MKWIMIIFVCMGIDCQQFQTESLFDTNEQCQKMTTKIHTISITVVTVGTELAVVLQVLS